MDPKAPDLHSVHKSCETSLNLNFAVLQVVLHQEGLLSIMSFVASVQEEFKSILENKKIDRLATSGKRLSVVSITKLPALNAKGE